jgi:ferric-dicitrate binding protein FerR (iron transport regulator)
MSQSDVDEQIARREVHGQIQADDLETRVDALEADTLDARVQILEDPSA